MDNDLKSYQKHILNLITSCIKDLGVFEKMLDFGSGDGWFSNEIKKLNLVKSITAIDVYKRKNTNHEILIYNGESLPFNTREFDITFSIDVLHHCNNSESTLKDLLRCTKNYLLIKDHNYNTLPEKALLNVLDLIGNREYTISLLNHYQKNFKWFPVIEKEGFSLVKLIQPAKCHTGILGYISNHLQFVGLWKRNN